MIELLHGVHRYLSAFAFPWLVPFLADWPAVAPPLRALDPTTLPVLSFLPGMSVRTDPAARPMVASLEACAFRLRWRQTYSAEDFGADFLDKYGLTELVGPRGLVESDRLVCGFLLLGPAVEYPDHSHEAEEVYFPLSPGTLWAKGGREWVTRPAGVPIHHPPWTAHAMKTGDLPLLALYLWRGAGLTRKPRIDG